MLRLSPAAFKRAWATPILREPPLKYLQSERPTTAAAKPLAIPTASVASAALRIAREPVAASSPSKIKAAVQDPTGTSVRAGCSGVPPGTVQGVAHPDTALAYRLLHFGLHLVGDRVQPIHLVYDALAIRPWHVPLRLSLRDRQYPRVQGRVYPRCGVLGQPLLLLSFRESASPEARFPRRLVLSASR